MRGGVLIGDAHKVLPGQFHTGSLSMGFPLSMFAFQWNPGTEKFGAGGAEMDVHRNPRGWVGQLLVGSTADLGVGWALGGAVGKETCMHWRYTSSWASGGGGSASLYNCSSCPSSLARKPCANEDGFVEGAKGSAVHT